MTINSSTHKEAAGLAFTIETNCLLFMDFAADRTRIKIIQRSCNASRQLYFRERMLVADRLPLPNGR